MGVLGLERCCSTEHVVYTPLDFLTVSHLSASNCKVVDVFNDERLRLPVYISTQSVDLVYCYTFNVNLCNHWDQSQVFLRVGRVKRLAGYN